MASGVTGLPSSSDGGKSSDGSHPKRKIASGCSDVRKKVCVHKDTVKNGRKKVSVLKDIVKAGATKTTGFSRPSLTKRKDRIDDENSDDSSPELDAARALTMFSQFVEERPPSPSPHNKAITIRKESVASLPQWSRKRRRSSRAKRAYSSSEDPQAKSEPPVEQQSEAASSLGKDSHSALTPVKVEASSGSVEQGCASDTGKQNNKLLSDSSGDFQQLDSRAESPTSPLPAEVRIGEVPAFVVYPKLEEGGRSAFQKVLPIRPVKKPAVSRKPKADDKSYEAATLEQAAVKLVTRKKPKPTGVGQLPVVKTEEADVGWSLSTTAAAPNEESTRSEENKCANPIVAAAVETALPEHVMVKIETKPTFKPGQRGGGKLKPAISESEKEARRQRRVQANRESARQTIRRKQVVCEELLAKAQHLTNDNEVLKQELKAKHMERNRTKAENLHLKEQTAKLNRDGEFSLHLREQMAKRDEGAAGSEFAPSESEKPVNGSVFKYPVPPVPYGQIAMPQMHPMPQLFWYAQAYAQAAQAAQASGMQQAGDLALALPGDYASSLSNFSMGLPSGYWVGLPQGGSQGGQASVLSHFFGHPSLVPSASKVSPPGGEEMSTPPVSSNSVVPIPAPQEEGSFSLGVCARDRGFDSGKSMGAYKGVAYSSFSHDGKKSAVKCESACDGSGFSNKPPFYKLSPPVTQAGMQTSTMGGVLPRKASGEEILCVPSTTGHLARASSGNIAVHLTKVTNPRYILGGAGRRYPDMMGQELSSMMAVPKPSGASAKAAEARRRRKEVQRSRSLLYRQAARVAEPSVS